VQYPDIMGRVPDLQAIADAAHAKGALLIVVNTEPVALGALEAPGHLGADIVVGEGQAIGVGLQFGGPYLGLFAITDPKHVRQMPGRLCGETVDADGKRGFVLTLSTREQHIRREKATSNICTNSGLCALAFSVHMTLLGEKGLRALAAENHRLACLAADRLDRVPGARVLNHTFFNEFTLMVETDARQLVRDLAAQDILAGVSLGRLFPDGGGRENGIVLAFTETTTEEDIERLASALEEALA
jgi:glycine dehydrogenase subunit 1